MKTAYERAAGGAAEQLAGAASWQPAETLEGLVEQGEKVGIAERRASLGEDVTGLQELVLYGLKGLAAYADHAQLLGFEDEEIWAFVARALDALDGGASDGRGADGARAEKWGP